MARMHRPLLGCLFTLAVIVSLACGSGPAAAGIDTKPLAGARSTTIAPGMSWRAVPVAHSLPYARVNGAAMTGPASGWAVGNQWTSSSGTNPDPGLPTIWRWTGTGWDVQNVLQLRATLDHVAADQGQAWASGEDISQPGPGTGLNLHWNGTAWQRAASQDLLFGIAAAGGSAWAYGLSADGSVDSILRWTGSDWAVANQPSGVTLLSIAASGASDVWVGGVDGDSGQPVLLHYDGSVWQQITPPSDVDIERLAASSPHNVWIAGAGGLAHFDGTTWSTVPVPWIGPYGPGAFGLDSAGRPWLTVNISLVANRSQYFHLAGGHWVQQLGPVIPQAIGIRTQTLSPVPGTCALLASGWTEVFNQPIAPVSEVQDAAGCVPDGNQATLPAIGPAVAQGGQAHTAAAPADDPAAGVPGAWQETPVPGAVQPLAGLADVATADPDTAWAVGHELKGRLAPGDPLILRWNGSTWRKEALFVHWTGALTAVAADSPRDAWAVGGEDPLQRGLPHALHWNGFTWKDVTFPSDTSSDVQLSGVAAVSPSTAWIAGSGPGGTPEMLRWDGATLTQVTLPIATGRLDSVRARGPSDVWAVGAQTTSAGTTPLILHFDGTAWHTLPSPAVGAPAQFHDVLPMPDGTAWAVGEYQVNSFFGIPGFLLEHWDGQEWTRISLPSSPIGALTKITADDQGNPEWISSVQFGVRTSVYLHFDGTAWQQVTGPAVPNVAANGQIRIAHVPGTTITLSAGSATLTGLDGQVYDVPLMEQNPGSG
jgi:hypothetical protein